MSKNDKAFQIFHSGLAFQIYNKAVRNGYLWDDKIFWKHMEYNGKKEIKVCDKLGFYNLEDCMDDCIKYINNYKNSFKDNTNIIINTDKEFKYNEKRT